MSARENDIEGTDAYELDGLREDLRLAALHEIREYHAEIPISGNVAGSMHIIPVSRIIAAMRALTNSPDTTGVVWVDAETHGKLVGRLTWRDEEGGYHEYSAAAASFLTRCRVAPEGR